MNATSNLKEELINKMRKNMFSQLLLDKRFQSLHRQLNHVMSWDIEPEYAAIILTDTNIIGLIFHEPVFVAPNQPDMVVTKSTMEWRVAPDYMNALRNIETNQQDIKTKIIKWLTVQAPAVNLKTIFEHYDK